MVFELVCNIMLVNVPRETAKLVIEAMMLIRPTHFFLFNFHVNDLFNFKPQTYSNNTTSCVKILILPVFS